MDHSPGGQAALVASTRVARRSRRMGVAAAVALAAAAVTYRAQLRLASEGGPADLAAPLRAAALFARGEDVYALFGPGRALAAPLNYPATSLLPLVPLADLPLPLAAALFVGTGMGLAAFASTASAWWPLFALLSWPALLACRAGQWAPLLTAAALLPGAGWLLACKPNVGVALAVQRLDRRWWTWTVVGGVALLAATLLRRPDWPLMWWRALSGAGDAAAGTARMRGIFLLPIANPLGPLLLLALARWRRPEARLLLALACVPQVTMGYEVLPLLVALPRSRVQALGLAVGSWLFAFAYAQWALAPTVVATLSRARWLLIFFFWLPGLALVLGRPNVGAVPAWVERALVRWRVPARLRGRPADGPGALLDSDPLSSAPHAP
ncbi:hypothetical protein [Roseisolibacter agri]|uniref:Uncharacterized protein n=1 Tax=Roseisolibacter agri TaxID=2014610 RepID=A0AA37V7I2_9BACT|nr:hypothetical protein [Roseisolibacter agri]GLC26666.1 hypothetical protein rosag_31790 [Roseisolibacter agri]